MTWTDAPATTAGWYGVMLSGKPDVLWWELGRWCSRTDRRWHPASSSVTARSIQPFSSPSMAGAWAEANDVERTHADC